MFPSENIEESEPTKNIKPLLRLLGDRGFAERLVNLLVQENCPPLLLKKEDPILPEDIQNYYLSSERDITKQVNEGLGSRYGVTELINDLDLIIQRFEIKLDDGITQHLIDNLFWQVGQEEIEENLIKILGITEGDMKIFRLNQEYRIKLLEWYHNPPNSIFYRISGLVLHDIIYLFNAPLQLITFAMLHKEFKVEKFLSYLYTLRAFLEIIYEAEKKEITHNIPIPVSRLLDTFAYVSGLNTFFNFDYFRDLEEFTSVRTLMLNAIENGAKSILVRRSASSKIITYLISDDASETDEWYKYVEHLNNAYVIGYENYDLPGIQNMYGGKIAALLAGQRAGKYHSGDKELLMKHEPFLLVRSAGLNPHTGLTTNTNYKTIIIKFPITS